MSNSENEDDPSIYQSSGSEWHDDEQIKRRSKRITTIKSRTTNKKTKTTTTSSDSESATTPKQKPARRRRSSLNKRQKVGTKSKTLSAKDYSTGSFLILKKDGQNGDFVNKPPCIWRIDGKALLQKYEPFDESGKTRYKTTSIYTGWSSLDKDSYAPITVTVQCLTNQSLIVDLNWEKLKKEINNMDSD